MAKSMSTRYSKTVDTSLAVTLTGDATAVGESTLATTKTTLTVTDGGKKAMAKGTIVTTAAAESPEGETAYASTYTDAGVGGADKLMVKTRTTAYDGTAEDGSEVKISTTVTKVKAIDIAKLEREDDPIVHDQIKTQEKTLSADYLDDHVSLDGNVAVAEFDVSASGDNTLATAEVDVLAIQGDLSLSVIFVVGAVD